MYAEVIIEYPVKSLDKFFTYAIPLKYLDIIKIGMKVTIPFGKTTLKGIVTGITDKKPDYAVKELISIENPEIFLNEEQMQIALFLKSQTLCTLITAYQTMLPSALKIKTQEHNYDLFETYIVLCDDTDYINKYILEHARSHRQIEIINALKKGKILKKAINSSALNALIKNKVVKIIKEKKNRINIIGQTFEGYALNDEQTTAYNTIKKRINEYNVFLLQGVTGSGKTEVYMHIISDVIKMGKTAIVLVPEICLTTQTVKRFYDRFGSDVAIFHSGLSNGEKYDEYLKIYHNEVKIVVGTRSSIFVPLKNLGIIIVDEEHSDTYKQDSNPRYDAIEIAKYRGKYHNIPVILASATPSLETRARADKNVYKLLLLNKRANNMSLPETILVDMSKEAKKGEFVFSRLLKEKITEKLMKKEQIILLLNRRGFSTFVNCTNCGFTYKCPNCDITLTYHKTTNNLRCHYCGFAIKKDELCPKCHENSLNYLGLGTQKLEEELHKLYPLARIIRMDQDTTSKKGSYQKIIDDFGDNKYDILLGTQMISKGLDFKNVTLVGIINADTSLNIPDFRSNEKTFNLLYQTSGRAGRDQKSGEVIIQTFNPDNEVLNYVKNNDYQRFYLYEMNIRHKLKYPPYVYIALITIKSSNYELASGEANKIKKILTNKLDNSLTVFGPTPASILKVNNIYNFQIIIKYTEDKLLKEVLKQIDESYIFNKNVNIEIAFNPSRF